MKLITAIMLTFVDLVSIVLSVVYIRDYLIQLGIVLILVFLLVIFVYKLFKIVIDEVEYAYVDFKKSYDEERKLNDIRFKEDISILKNNNDSLIKIMNEINVNIILMNKYIQENNKELSKLFEAYFNQMKIEFYNQNKANIEGINNLSVCFNNKLEVMGSDFNYNLGQVKQKLTEGLLEYNTVFQHSLNSNLNGLYDNTINLLNNITTNISNGNVNTINTFDNKIKDLTMLINKYSNDLIGILDKDLSKLQNFLEKNSLELHSDMGNMIKSYTENNNTLIEGITINSKILFDMLNENRIEINNLLTENTDNLYKNISDNSSKLYTKVDEIGDINKNTLTNIDALTVNINRFENSLNTSISDLISCEKNLITEISTNNNQLNTTITEGIENLNSNYLKSSDNSGLVLKELKSVLVDMGALIDDSIVVMKENIKEENIKHCISLGAVFEKQIKDLNRRLQDGNRQWQEVSEEIDKNNTQSVSDVKRAVMEMNSLHKELLKSLNENQRRMVELNEEDIKLMRDMIL